MRLALTAAALLLLLPPAALAGEVKVGEFSAGDLSGWESEEFSGRTDYRIVEDGGRKVLQAVSRGAASGLVKELELDIRQSPMLRWSWKVEDVVAGGDARKKSGDDYAARVYVVFPATFFWNTRGINYIWANQLPRGEAVPNPYTDNVIMVAVRSGQDPAGKWFSEERDVYADYRRLFGEEPPALGAVAIMTDTDNTGGSATAYYGDISLGPRRP